MRSKVEPMKDVARLIRRHFDGIVAWTQTRQTNGFIEAINGLFQAAKRKARGYARFVIVTGDCHLLIADNVVLPAFCAKTYRLRSTIDVQNGISKVSVGLSLALLISREALAATVKYFMGILTEVSASVRCSFGDHT